MANPKQLRKLEAGVLAWNEWKQRRGEDANLSGANLAGKDLGHIDLQDAMLLGTDLSGSDLGHANLTYANLCGANLTGARLVKANLGGADLSKATLDHATLYQADLSGANLERAYLIDSDLSQACLRRARLVRATMTGSNLAGADLRKTNFYRAALGRASFLDTVFGRTDFREATGLDDTVHLGPSSLDHDTVRWMGHAVPEFLRGCGMPDRVIALYTEEVAQLQKYRSCFISYNQRDEAFVRKLYGDLQAAGVRCWFAPEDMRIGDRIRNRIDEAIGQHDHLLLVLSANSFESPWIEKEVETAFRKETKLKIGVLLPIRLDDSILDVESGWSSDIRNARQIGDFSNWQDATSYERALERLLRDIRITESDQD